MSKTAKPWVIYYRNDTKTFQITLNPSCGLSRRICAEWIRKSYLNLPDELYQYKNPKNKTAADTGALALVNYLKKKQSEGNAVRFEFEDITVGDWLKKFTTVETSPRTEINASENRPNSEDTLDNYLGYYNLHIKDDPFTLLRMAETEENDVLAFIRRMSLKKLKDGRVMGGTRTFAGVIVFVRMAFKNYQSKNRRWINPFQYIKRPKHYPRERDFLTEDEMLKLFYPGVLRRTIDLAVCCAIFLSGLRRSEVSALKPEDLDWNTPKITVRRAWQNFDKKDKKVLGPPKSKKERKAPFDPVMQAAIKKLWEENGRHEFVFTVKTGKKKDGIKTIGQSWTGYNLERWIKRAGIELNGRKIAPHSARHTLASLLENKGEALRHIQDLLGHANMKTTKIYLHSTAKTIRAIGEKISESMAAIEDKKQEEKPENIINFKVS